MIIATSDQFHVPLELCKPSQAGKHVLVEKPLGTTIEECEALRAAVKRRAWCCKSATIAASIRASPSPSDSSATRLGQRMGLKYWYYDSTYRYTMTDNLQPLSCTAQSARRPPGNPKENKRRYFLLTHGSHLVDSARFLGGEIAGDSRPAARAFRRVLLVCRSRFRRRQPGPSRHDDRRARRFRRGFSDLRRAWQRDRQSPSALVPQIEHRRMFFDQGSAISPAVGRRRLHLQTADRKFCRRDPRRRADGKGPTSTMAWPVCERWWPSPARPKPASRPSWPAMTGAVE